MATPALHCPYFIGQETSKLIGVATLAFLSLLFSHSSQELEQLRHENEDLQMQFFQQGKDLISRNKQSLAAEMENASKEEVCYIRLAP